MPVKDRDKNKMQSRPLVSIILPTWNRASILPRALVSIKAQSFTDYEVLVVDDGSEDDTQQLLSHHDAPIRCLSQAHGGVASARNLGIEHARGRWIAFLDSDDTWMPEKLLTQMQALEQNPEVSMVFSDYEVWDESRDQPELVQTRRYLDEDTSFAALARRNFIGTLTAVVHREALATAGGFDESLVRGSDFDAWLRIARNGKIMRVPGVFARYRRHPKSLTGLDSRQDANTRDEVLARFRERWPEIEKL